MKIIYVIFYNRSGDGWYIPIRQTQQYSENEREKKNSTQDNKRQFTLVLRVNNWNVLLYVHL